MMVSGEFAFVGVSTGKSAVNAVFRDWCGVLGVNWKLRTIDIPIGADAGTYSALMTILRRSDVVGGLVTTHKARLFTTNWAEFSLIEPVAFALEEIGVVYRRDGALCGGVSDVASGQVILQELVQDERWLRGNREALVLGAGGAGLAAAWNLAVLGVGDPKYVTIVESDVARREQVERLVREWPAKVRLLVSGSLSGVRKDKWAQGSGTLIINATGLGKDRPGTPLPSDFKFPSESTVWEFNYRGDLEFLVQAQRADPSLDLLVVDGSRYFISGWSTVMCRVAGMTWSPEIRAAFSGIAFGKGL